MKSFGKNSITRIILILTGFFALIWFLVRVIPKPSRASYPCQRAAFPFASTFVIWLTGSVFSIFLFKRGKRRLFNGRILTGMLIIIFAATSLFVVNGLSFNYNLFAGNNNLNQLETFWPTDKPNHPIGEATGLFPGRVVWSHDPDATFWDGNTTTTNCDGVSSATSCWETSNAWWANVNLSSVKSMMQESLLQYTETSNSSAAWDSLFYYFNRKNRSLNQGYLQGQKIAIKLNLNTVSSHDDKSNSMYVAPQVVYALLEQLVNNAGIADSNITFYDISKPMPGTIFGICKAGFPNVRFVDKIGGNGREKYILDENVKVHWSEELNLEPNGGYTTYLPTCITEATYLINLSNLKGHDLTGVTICAKNHFGSYCTKAEGNAPQRAGVHPYIAVHGFGKPGNGGEWDFYGRDMETYNPLVDLIGHPHLGGKTLLYMVDALYTTRKQNADVAKGDRWQIPPFHNDWASSMFLSQDPLAIESVGLDFLRSEFTQFNVKGNVDNYLHEAAQCPFPASSTLYDPDADGIALQSPGVHEHWNNGTDKQYSRNLGTGDGIELVKVKLKTATHSTFEEFSNQILIYPNPADESFRLKLDHVKSNKMDIKLYDLHGKIHFTKIAYPQYAESIDEVVVTNHLKDGIYILSLEAENFMKTKKIVVKH